MCQSSERDVEKPCKDWIQKLRKPLKNDAKGKMMLAARKDIQLTITAEGPGEEEVIGVLSKLVESGFDEVIHFRV
jgi:phosphotransferase system HPr-like phosphotransfer protein